MPKRVRDSERTDGDKSHLTDFSASTGDSGLKCLRIPKDRWPTPKQQRRLYDDGWVCWGCFEDGDFKYVRYEEVKHLMN